MPRRIFTALCALVLLTALSSLPAWGQNTPAPQGRKGAPQKRVNPNAEPRERAPLTKNRERTQPNQAARAPGKNARKQRMPGSRQSNAPVRIKERNPENPVRFAFAPHAEKKHAAAGMPWDETPSAGAVMSTFLTGEISPELVNWHVNQRKKAEYEKRNAALAADGRRGAQARQRSEYGEMLSRMQFAWGDGTDAPQHAPAVPYDGSGAYGGTYADMDDARMDGGGYDDEPSGGSILVQLLTGYKNGEMREWKENQVAAARRDAPWRVPEREARPMPERMYAQSRPAAAPRMRPVPENEMKNADGREPIRTAAAEMPRFVDDGFPTDEERIRYTPVRQVSAEVRTPAPARVLGQGEQVTRAGQIRVYAEDEDGWSPAE